LRSHPVQFYGFFPPGWLATDGSENMPAEQRSGDAFAGTRYLHFGARSVGETDTSSCPSLAGGDVPCKEHLAFRLLTPLITLDPPLVVGGTGRSFEVRFRHRNGANAAGKLRVSMIFHDGPIYAEQGEYVPLEVAHASWHAVDPPVVIQAQQSETAEIDGFELKLEVTLADQVFGFLDLDAIELVDLAAPGTPLLTVSLGGFEAEPGTQTHSGDYAANAIDRLGAIGWWGSTSHYQGFGYGRLDLALQSFFAGRSFGESVLASRGAGAGLVYGDPLYRPGAAALFVPSLASTRPVESGGSFVVVTSENLERSRYVFMNALDGTSPTRLQNVNWELAVCPLLGPEACTSWVTKQSDQGSVKERPVDWLEFLDDPNVDQQVTIRLKVWNSGEEADALYDFASFDYQAAP
jgi:hypothetical protein